MRYVVALLLGLSGCQPELRAAAHSGSEDRCAFRVDEGTSNAKGLAFEELERNPGAFEGQRVRVRGRLRSVSAYQCENWAGPIEGREMWFPEQGSIVFDCHPLQPHAVSVATTANCTSDDWPDPWIESEPSASCIPGINCDGDQSVSADSRIDLGKLSIWRQPLAKLELASCSPSHGRHADRYGLSLSAMYALECDGRMVSMSGTVRKGALIRVTAIEPE